MNRSGYTDDCDDNWRSIMYRGAVKSAIRGTRGQELLRDMIAALDAMPDKRLIAGELEEGGDVCALGSVGKFRGVEMSGLDPGEPEEVAAAFKIAPALAREVVYMNDERFDEGSPEKRWERMRAWAVSKLEPQP